MDPNLMQQDPAALAVLCINCDNYVEVDDLTQHSGVCYKITNTVLDDEDKLTVAFSQAKFSRLGQMMESMAARAVQPREKNYLAVMLRVCQKTATADLNTSMKDLDSYLAYLETSTLQTKVSMGVQLCADRLKALIDLHKAAMRQHEQANIEDQVQLLQDELKSYQNLTEKLKADLSHIKTTMKLDEVKSETYSVKSGVRSEVSEFSSADSEELSFPIMTPFDCEDDQKETQKRMFYSTALTCKMSYPQNHPARKVPISKVHRLSLQKGIPAEKWRHFITSYLDRLSLDFKETSRGIYSIPEHDEH